MFSDHSLKCGFMWKSRSLLELNQTNILLTVVFCRQLAVLLLTNNYQASSAIKFIDIIYSTDIGDINQLIFSY